MWKTIWCSTIIAATTAAATIGANFAIGEIVSYRTCTPSQWEYGFHPTWLPTVVTAFFALGAVMLVWSWKRGGPIISGIRLFFLLISALHLYALIDLNRLIEYNPDRLLFLSCGGENWKDFEEIAAGAVIFLGVPMAVIVFFLVLLVHIALVFLRRNDAQETQSASDK